MAGRPRKYFSEEEKRLGRNLREAKRRERNPDKFIIYDKEYREKNKEVLEEKRKERYVNNREKRLLYSKTWAKNNPEKRKETRNSYCRDKVQKDSLFKFTSTVRSLIGQSFRRVNLRKSKRTEEILGCTLEEFRIHILSLCPEGVELKDFNRYGYHLDHIVPISSASTEEEVTKLCHYTNIQPLWCSDNIKKSNKILSHELLQLL